MRKIVFSVMKFRIRICVPVRLRRNLSALELTFGYVFENVVVQLFEEVVNFFFELGAVQKVCVECLSRREGSSGFINEAFDAVGGASKILGLNNIGNALTFDFGVKSCHVIPVFLFPIIRLYPAISSEVLYCSFLKSHAPSVLLTK